MCLRNYGIHHPSSPHQSKKAVNTDGLEKVYVYSPSHPFQNGARGYMMFSFGDLTMDSFITFSRSSIIFTVEQFDQLAELVKLMIESQTFEHKIN